MLVREVMTRRPITVGPDTSVKDALVLLDDHSITMMPVVSHAGSLVGVVSEADLVRDALQPDPRAHMVPDAGWTERPTTVVDVMNHRTLTVTGDADLAEAVDLMTSTAVKSLPVIDEHHHVVGVLSRRDVVHLLARRDDAVEREMDALFQSLGVDWLAEVSEGVVTVMGPVDERERALARTAAATVPGVVSVTVS